MKIAIIYPAPAKFSNNHYYVKEAFGRRIVGLSYFFDQIYLFLPVSKSPLTEHTFQIDQSKIIVYPLPHTTYALSFLLVYPLLIGLNKILSMIDVVYIGFPTLVAFPLWMYSKLYKFPTVLHIVSDVVDVVNSKDNAMNSLYIFERLLALKLEKLSFLMAKRSLVISNGSHIYRKYINVAQSSLLLITGSVFDHEVIESTNKLIDIDEETPFNILFVGALIERKGLQYLLLAVDNLVRVHNLNVILTVVGDGPLRKQYKMFVNNKHLNHHVNFVGYISQSDGLFNYFQEADVFVLPTLSEGTPRVLIEAMSQGAPVIATRVSGVPDIIMHGENGLLVKPKNWNDIVNAILYMIHRPKVKERMIKAGLETAKQHTIEAQSRKIYKAVLNYIN